ncbi:DUF421 domain-containing protein [Herbaspirillum huttiense]|uniref:DUF421 domain-containing protein n=1 Tax=Herbaspirillum huttiense subsp. lycopersici TaxID=3074428 RepID=A0ABU2EU89_9BURK|nr:YetF domain-containing protein [Herbaspirillum huttiense]MDR9851747.1 DUF421 domain-containing protein [Herbaspirillum huttiense SE1]
MNVQWDELTNFSVSPWEIVLRGTLVYLFLFTFFRFVLRRDTGNVGVGDFLLVVIVADASQNGMSGESDTVPDALLLVLTLMAWNYLIDVASYRSARIRRWLEPQPLPLVENGRMLRRNMRKELVTPDEIQAKLRENGIASLDQVACMTMESDGELSVLKKSQ